MSGRAGYSLVELMVALVVASVILAGAAGLLTGLVDLAFQLRSRSDLVAQDGTTRAWLYEAFTSMRVDPHAGGAFTGTPDSASFSTRLTVPYGWKAGEQVTLRLRRGRLLLSSSRRSVVLLDSVVSFELAYVRPGNETLAWSPSYESVTRPPAAIQVSFERSDLGVRQFVFFGGGG